MALHKEEAASISRTERWCRVKIESVDFYYLSMPEVLDIGDGSQDVLLVRVQAGE